STARGWNPFDAALMRATDEWFENCFISDRTWHILAARYDIHQMTDLVMTVGGYHMLAMAVNSFGIRPDPGGTSLPPRGYETAPKPSHRASVDIRLAKPRISPTAESDWSSDERELLTPFKQQRGYVMNVYGTLTR